ERRLPVGIGGVVADSQPSTVNRAGQRSSQRSKRRDRIDQVGAGDRLLLAERIVAALDGERLQRNRLRIDIQYRVVGEGYPGRARCAAGGAWANHDDR